MGGYGSGQHQRYRAKPSTDDGYRLDVRWLARNGYIVPPDVMRASVISWSIRGTVVADAFIEHDGDADTLTVKFYTGQGTGRRVLDVDRTECTYGGYRPWLVCPGCRQRRAVVYVYAGWIACRRCHGMNYATTRMSVVDRLGYRADRLRARIDPTAERFGWPVPDRPSGMHRRTYHRLVDDLHATTLAAMAAIMGRVDRLER